MYSEDHSNAIQPGMFVEMTAKPFSTVPAILTAMLKTMRLWRDFSSRKRKSETWKKQFPCLSPSMTTARNTILYFAPM